MSGPWAARAPLSSLEAIGRLRLHAGIEGAVSGDAVWIRGEALEEPLEPMLRSIPGAILFRRGADSQLTLWNHRVPTDRLPALAWQSLRNLLSPAIPEALFAAATPEAIPMRLERPDVPAEPRLLLTTISEWRRFAAAAPQVRLSPLTFAASSDGRVLVRGVPLPSLPGERFSLQDDIALPLGWTSLPAVDAKTMREKLGLRPGEVACFHIDGTWERIASHHFVRASRSAARATAESSGEDGPVEAASET